MRAVCSIARYQPCTHTTVITRVLHWLTRIAEWDGTRYTDTVIPSTLQPKGYELAWCGDLHLLLSLFSM